MLIGLIKAIRKTKQSFLLSAKKLSENETI